VTAHDWSVESLGAFRVKTRWSSKPDLWPSFKETRNPGLTGFLPAECLGLLPNSPFGERMKCVREENDPINENPNSFW
jgi:hypothetical protein